jgi:hypothetical protein
MEIKNIDLPPIPVEKDYVIAYIDMLGTQELLSNKDTENVFEHIYYSILTSTKMLPKIEKLNMDSMQFKVFSDNILVAYPVEDTKDKKEVFIAYQKIQTFLHFFLSMFVTEGFLFRGAITVNKLLINELMVWGAGLSEVVHLEENVAIYPRVIISEELLKVFDEYNLSDVEFEEKFSCLKDSDDNVYFDFFNYSDWQAMDSHLPLAKAKIIEKIQKEKGGKNRAKILQKYNWFKNYLDEVEQIYNEVKSNYDI